MLGWVGDWSYVLHPLHSSPWRCNSSGCSNRGTQHTCSGLPVTLTPIAINTATILLVGLLFNALFHWRRYPAFLLSKETEKDYTNSEYASVDHADFVYALSQMDTFIDVTEDDLLKIYQLATGREINSNN